MRIAQSQGGAVSRLQLIDCGLSNAAIWRWKAEGRLHRVLPAVYAFGRPELTVRGRLFAALLYAGPGAALSHQTAGWAWRVVSAEPRRVHVSTELDRRSLDAVCVHRVARLEVVTPGEFPVTPLPRTLLDLAATLPFDATRRVLAEADHLGLLDPTSVRLELGRGRAGSRPLRRALELHLPELADTQSRLEEEFLLLCERAAIPMPEVNVFVEGLKVDCVWHERRLVVELDGHASHAYAAAAEVDRHRDLTLRSAGHTIVRYTWHQVTRAPERVIADLRSLLAR